MKLKSDMDDDQLVLVYGTLRRGGSNAFRMDGSEYLISATVMGRLFRIDWYPGLILDDTGSAVVGDVFRVPPGQMPALDQYEGPEYQRVMTAAACADGKVRQVWVWEWIRPVDGLREVVAGDWLAEGV